MKPPRFCPSGARSDREVRQDFARLGQNQTVRGAIVGKGGHHQAMISGDDVHSAIIGDGGYQEPCGSVKVWKMERK